MNRHGRHAMDMVKRYDPESYARISDPETHFSTLGGLIKRQIRELTPARGLKTDVSLSNIARVIAREMVYHDVIYALLPIDPVELELLSLTQDSQSPRQHG